MKWSTRWSKRENLQDVALPAAPGKVHAYGPGGMHLNSSGLPGILAKMSLLATSRAQGQCAYR